MAKRKKSPDKKLPLKKKKSISNKLIRTLLALILVLAPTLLLLRFPGIHLMIWKFAYGSFPVSRPTWKLWHIG